MRAIGGSGAVSLQETGKRFSGQDADFQGADDAAPIVPINPIRRHRVAGLQISEQVRRGQAIQLCPKSEICWGQLRNPAFERLEIETGATDNQWNDSALIQRGDRLAGKKGIFMGVAQARSTGESRPGDDERPLTAQGVGFPVRMSRPW